MSLRQTRIPLFHARLLAERLAGHLFPPDLAERHAILKSWVSALRAGKLDAAKEVSLHGDFLGDVFGRALGYRTITTSGAGHYELSAEKTVGAGGKSADGALGFFGPGSPGAVLAPIELKGAKQSLDHALGRVLTPVQQAWEYANHSPGCRFIVVSNYRETRLYSTSRTPESYEPFFLEELENLDAFKRFYFLLAREQLLPAAPGGASFADELLAASAKEEAQITKRLYEDYRDLRKRLFQDLCQRRSDLPAAALLQYAQIILDRVLFIAFAEDRGLLPAKTIESTCDHRDRFRPVPVWKNFCVVFRWIDKGHEAERYPAYNGGLFRPDQDIDELDIPDEMCAEFKKLAAYDYREDVSVDVLGHIFEQSISDLEELRGSSGITPPGPKISRRKTEGIFYTPAFVTRFIVDRTLNRTLNERWQSIVAASPIEGKKLKEGSAAWLAAWRDVYERYREELKRIRVLDLSCGSGAFLIAAFDALSREYDRINAELAELNKGQATIFDLTKTVLNNNLFGVDVNAESVEITKLSLWLKTAERGRQLTYLDSNVKWGNSIVEDAQLDVLSFDWRRGTYVKSAIDLPTAPEAAEIDARWQEGFDVVIGNPPYVRQELLGNIKPHLEKTYRSYHGMADLFVYFFERGIQVLKPGGRLGFVVANKWIKSGYAEALRGLLASETRVETLVDFGHAPIFPEADAFPCILTLSKGPPDPSSEVEVTMLPRDKLEPATVSEYVHEHRYPVPQSRFGSGDWNLETPAADKLLRTIRAAGAPLSTVVEKKPYRGLLTGLNEAFVVNEATRRRLVAADPACGSLFAKYVRGQDIHRWSAEWKGIWLLRIKSSGDQTWPWSGKSDVEAEKAFVATFPSIHAHLKEHEDALRRRTDKGRYWWELRSCAYYDLFDAPKIAYQVIQYHPAYALDVANLWMNDKGFFLPSCDLWLLAILNSPLMWWHNWRYLTHLKDEALTPLAIKMESLPIAPATGAIRAEAEPKVARLVEITRLENESRAAVLDSLRMQFGVEEPGNKLSDFASLEPDVFVQEALKRRPKSAGKLKAADMKSLREMYGDEAVPIQARRREALSLERDLSGLVNRAYGLTSEEMALLWSTAPPRMPFQP